MVYKWCKHMCKHGVNICLNIGVNICANIDINIGVKIGVNMQKEHFVCIILCEIFILTLLGHTYIGCQQVSTLVGFLFHHCCVIPTFFCTLFVSSFVRFSLPQCLPHGVS